eukprot:scaffold205111_cov19-Tisochrysis_lutea.AAC.1
MMPTQLAPVHRERELTPEGRTSLGLTAASGDIDEFEVGKEEGSVRGPVFCCMQAKGLQDLN